MICLQPTQLFVCTIISSFSFLREIKWHSENLLLFFYSSFFLESCIFCIPLDTKKSQKKELYKKSFFKFYFLQAEKIKKYAIKNIAKILRIFPIIYNDNIIGSFDSKMLLLSEAASTTAGNKSYVRRVGFWFERREELFERIYHIFKTTRKKLSPGWSRVT